MEKMNLSGDIARLTREISPERIAQGIRKNAEMNNPRFGWMKTQARKLKVAIKEDGRVDVFDEQGTCMIRPVGSIAAVNGLFTIPPGTDLELTFGGPDSALSRELFLWDIELAVLQVGANAWTPAIKTPLVGVQLRRVNESTMILPDKSGSSVPCFPIGRYIRNSYNPVQLLETRNPLGIVDSQNAVGFTLRNTDPVDSVVVACVGISQQYGD